MKVYLVRHGESQWNLENRVQGSDDSDLTKKGIEDLYQLKKHFANEKIKIHQIYSSDSKRAFESAKILNQESKIKIKKSSALKEMNAGSWQGKTWDEIKRKHPLAYDNYWFSPDLYEAEKGGEDFYALEKRAIHFIKELLEEKRDENILIVSHGVTIKSIVNYYRKDPISDFWKESPIKSASLSLIESDDEVRVSFIGKIFS